MRILDHLDGTQDGSQAVENIAKAFAIEPAAAKAAVSAIVPELSRAIERNTLNRGGIADMVAALGKADPARTLSAGADLASPAIQDQGIVFLEQIFGTKDKSRGVAARVARDTGLQDDLIKKMLPAVAAMTMAALAKGSSSSLQNVLSKVPGLQATGPLSMPGDFDNNRPVLKPGGNIPHQSPLPIPGDNLPDMRPSQSPYDELPDVIRRGEVTVPGGGSSGGGSLGSVIRDILGGLLGFQNRGFFGWLLQAVILPMILRVVQSVLRRVLTGR